MYRVSGRGPFWVSYVGVDGKRYAESSGSSRKGDAERLLRSRVGDLANGLPITPQAGRITFDEAVRDMTSNYETKGRKSLDELERRVRLHLRPFFGGARLLISITSAEVTAYVVARKGSTIIERKERRFVAEDGAVTIVPEARRPVSNGEINRELTTLRRMYSLAVQNGKLFHRPSIELLPEAAARKGFFVDDEITAVCAHLSSEVAAVVRYAYATAWRVSEVLNLTWDRVDFTEGRVWLDKGQTKNGEKRTFPMTDALRRLLRERQAAAANLKRESSAITPYVFFRMVADGRGGRKQPKPIRSFNKRWKTACEAVGCPGRIPHDLRRSGVRNFVRAGLGEHVAMKLSGHLTPSIFRRYDIVSEQDLMDAAAQLNAAARQATTRRGVVRSITRQVAKQGGGAVAKRA